MDEYLYRIGDCDSAWAYWRGDSSESLREREGGHTQGTWARPTAGECKNVKIMLFIVSSEHAIP